VASTKRQENQPAATNGRPSRDGIPRLAWSTKPTTVERVALPFQIVETINESRATREAERDSLFALGETEVGNWRNKLVWGDNKLVTASLLEQFAGKVKLVYIDPPFDTGSDFSFRVKVGDETLTKTPSVIEELAYRDTWGAGRSSYLQMMYERLVLISDLLVENGSLYLHCGPTVSHYLKVMCDEIFGSENFRNEIVWKRKAGRGETNSAAIRFGVTTESILFYAKSPATTFNRQYGESNPAYIASKFTHVDENGRRYQLDNLSSPSPRPNLTYEYKGYSPPPKGWAVSRERMEEMEREGRLYFPADKSKRMRRKRYLDELAGDTVDNLWDDIPPVNSMAAERVGFDTQKPIALLTRVLEAATEPGDLVADFFCGSGTTLVAAEQLGRHWIGCDLGRFAIHTTRKRLLDVRGCSPFEILNLGSYERQHWQQVTTGDELGQYLSFILALYDALPIEGHLHLHGKKGDRLVHVGAVDAPVTIDEIEQVMDELADNDLTAADVLGWEWEMGLHDVVGEEARRRGLDVRCRQIPREVMKADVGDEVRFFELAYLELQVDRKNKSARVQLRDFVIPSEELIPDEVRSKITQWSDYVDYWSVDFNFRDDTFHNEWQAYRTREKPTLAVESDWHDYDRPGRYAIVVKVIDIFGNDTTKLAEVVIK
jgi:adenine-specific DNA-methyltransferase